MAYALTFTKSSGVDSFAFDKNLAELFNLKEIAGVYIQGAFAQRLNSPSSFYIHRDLVGKENNRYKGKPSDSPPVKESKRVVDSEGWIPDSKVLN